MTLMASFLTTLVTIADDSQFGALIVAVPLFAFAIILLVVAFRLHRSSRS